MELCDFLPLKVRCMAEFQGDMMGGFGYGKFEKTIEIESW
jgi:hypothetical protein